MENIPSNVTAGFLGGSEVKNPPPNEGDRFNPWVKKISWRREWQPTPVFLPGKSRGQSTLAPWATVHAVARAEYDLATKRQQGHRRQRELEVGT